MSGVSPELRPWLDNLNQVVASNKANGITATPVSLRESLAAMTRALVTRHPDLPWVRDAMVATEDYPVPVRLYDPAPDREKPVCLFFHGGGHMAGGVSVYDPIARKLALASNHLVASVEYRLAPECPYPLGVEDCVAVTRHIWSTLAAKQRRVSRRLSLAGDSGGGSLAASVSTRGQTDASIQVHRQVLIYPSLDYTLAYPSVAENGQGYFLEQERIRYYFDHYFQPGADRRAASPLHMAFSRNLPTTLMITAGQCPLRDEALAYLDRLDEHGVPYQHLHMDDMIHAYLNLENLIPESCARTYDTIGRFLNNEQ